MSAISIKGLMKSYAGNARMAAVSDLSSQAIHDALASTTVQDVQNWTRDHLGLSLPAQRQRALGNTPFGTLPG